MVCVYERGCVTIALMALVCFAASCKAPTEAKAGSCGVGSQSLSVFTRHDELSIFSQKADSTVLEGLTGVGGCLTYRKLASGADARQGIKVCNFDQVYKPADQRFPLCTAHFQKHGDPVDGKQRLLVWTSRNCLDYGDPNVEFFVEFRSDGMPIKVQVPRMKWPSGVRSQLAADQEFAAKQNTEAIYRAVSVFADVHNFEHFMIEMPADQWGPSTPAAPGTMPKLGQRLQEVFHAQAKHVAEMRSRKAENTQLLQKWLLLTEKQAVLRVMQAVAKACPASVGGGCKAQVEKDLQEEFVAAMQHYDLPDVRPLFRNMWLENKLWGNISNDLTALAEDRQKLFADLFRRVRELSVPAGGPQVAQGKSSNITLSGGSPEDLAFMHGYWQERGEGVVSSVISYQGLPMRSIFSQANGASMAPNDEAARGITFSPNLSLNANDEGQMISLFGIAPVAFVSSKQVERGKFTGAPLPSRSTQGQGVYRATGCN